MSRVWARRACQSAVLLPLFALILLPEYVQGLGDPESKSGLYRVTAGPWRMIDLLLLGLIVAHSVVWASSRKLQVRFPQALAWPAIGFGVSIALAMVYGAANGGTNLFFDWRALALGVGLYGVFALWMQSNEGTAWAITLFVATMTAGAAAVFARYVCGGGDVIVGMRIPVFDGPTLSAMVFAGVLSLCLADATRGLGSFLWMGLAGSMYLLVLLCFRRTFWAELGIATVLLVVIQGRGRSKKLLLAAIAVAITWGTLGDSAYERLQSLDITRADSTYSQGNPDHVGELLDAWEQVKSSPVLGIGLGRSFPTTRIQGWKEESVMVHNAPLHVWLKYGLLGLVCYAWFHMAALAWLRQKVRRGARQNALMRPYRPLSSCGQTNELSQTRRAWKPESERTVAAFTTAALAYLSAQFAVSLGFAPWPYSSLQSATLIAFLLAVAVRGAHLWNCQVSR